MTFQSGKPKDKTHVFPLPQNTHLSTREQKYPPQKQKSTHGSFLFIERKLRVNPLIQNSVYFLHFSVYSTIEFTVHKNKTGKVRGQVKAQSILVKYFTNKSGILRIHVCIREHLSVLRQWFCRN